MAVARLVCYDEKGNITFDSSNCVSSRYINTRVISGEGSFYDANIADASNVWFCPLSEAIAKNDGFAIRPKIIRNGGTVYYEIGASGSRFLEGTSEDVVTQTIMYGVY